MVAQPAGQAYAFREGICGAPHSTAWAAATYNTSIGALCWLDSLALQVFPVVVAQLPQLTLYRQASTPADYLVYPVWEVQLSCEVPSSEGAAWWQRDAAAVSSPLPTFYCSSVFMHVSNTHVHVSHCAHYQKAVAFCKQSPQLKPNHTPLISLTCLTHSSNTRLPVATRLVACPAVT